jgi:hypothetical protein
VPEEPRGSVGRGRASQLGTRSDLVMTDLSTQANSARIYDWLLGGTNNFKADREAGEAVMRAVPQAKRNARENRRFLSRAVAFMAARGIDQFLDLGSGLPTVGNVHEVARSINPDARVLYVDSDPAAYYATLRVLSGDSHAGATCMDLRHANSVLASSQADRLLDFTKPIGLLAVAVLHFVPDSDDPVGLLRTYRRAMAAGSYLALSHVATVLADAQVELDATKVYADTNNSVTPRALDSISGLFDGFDILRPGLVPVSHWHTNGSADVPMTTSSDIYGGVGQLCATQAGINVTHGQFWSEKTYLAVPQ